jgi:hypothetical protein
LTITIKVKEGMSMESTMAEFTVRVIREGDETKTQLLVHGVPVRETLPKPISLTGNEDYQNIFTLVLNAFHKEQ